MLDDQYIRPLLHAFGWQLGIVVLGALCLDFGQFRQASGIASVGFWVGAILILLRRPLSPTKADLTFIDMGLLLVVALGVPVAYIVWAMRGAF